VHNYGVSCIDSYSPTDNLPGGGRGGGDSLLPVGIGAGTEVLYPGEHPFPTRYATRRATMRFEPGIYLEALMRDAVAFGGAFVIRRFDSPRDLVALPETIIANCSGLGRGSFRMKVWCQSRDSSSSSSPSLT